PLVDKEMRIIGVLGGRPNDPDYLRQTEKAAEELKKARGELNFRPDQRGGRRGAFSSVSAGISFGGGQQVCSPLRLILAVIDNDIQQFFPPPLPLPSLITDSGLFRTRNPAVHTLFAMTLDALIQNNSGLRRNFAMSAFAAATLNFGPSTVTLPHIDALNLAWGWCAITALGIFDPDAGGHLVLWDLKLVIRFPPGSTILIPSAILRHSNVGIGPNERRYSFTQYSAAGLFRWVSNRFHSDLTVNNTIRDDPLAQAERERARCTRWADGVNSFQRWNGGRM
ncbi:hypothetical protein B0H14DRAFT_2335644, partial [Mycena olivaceomarginata]